MDELSYHILLPTVVGLLGHFTVEPTARDWHRTLRKSAWTPPPICFPFVWLLCYANLGFASHRAYKAGAGAAQAAAYAAHVLLVNSFNPLFFLTRRLRLCALLLAAVVATTPVLLAELAVWDKFAALCLLPYYGWLLLLAHLASYMATHNPGEQFGNHDRIKAQSLQAIDLVDTSLR